MFHYTISSILYHWYTIYGIPVVKSSIISQFRVSLKPDCILKTCTLLFIVYKYMFVWIGIIAWTIYCNMRIFTWIQTEYLIHLAYNQTNIHEIRRPKKNPWQYTYVLQPKVTQLYGTMTWNTEPTQTHHLLILLRCIHHHHLLGWEHHHRITNTSCIASSHYSEHCHQHNNLLASPWFS